MRWKRFDLDTIIIIIKRRMMNLEARNVAEGRGEIRMDLNGWAQWILDKAAKPVFSWLKQKGPIRRLLDHFGWDPVQSTANFLEVYQRTLAEYERNKPKQVVDFFRDPETMKIFRKVYEHQDPSLFLRQSEEYVSSRIERAMRELNYDPRCEYDSFCMIFNRLVDESRTPFQARFEHTQMEIHSAVMSMQQRMEEQALQASGNGIFCIAVINFNLLLVHTVIPNGQEIATL